MSRTTSIKNAISIPFRIKRSPTDLLKALSSTVGIEANTPSYSVIDDTQLMPNTLNDEKRFCISESYGKKAARMMIQAYPQAFMIDDCVPRIPKFFPLKTFTEQELKYPSEKLIYSLMSWGKLKQAFDIYSKCKDQNIEVSEACKLTFLDLLCINNSNDVKEKKPIKEEWITRGDTQKPGRENRNQPLFSSWEKNSLAELIFADLKAKTPEAYCSLIKGMIKYSNNEVAFNLYDEMKKKNLTPDIGTMNSLMSVVAHLTELNNEDKSKQMIEKLNEIKTYGLQPNLRTFNVCFDIIKSMRINPDNIPLTLNVLKEMEFVKIEPSLATWAKVLSIFYPASNIGIGTDILSQVLNEVEKNSNTKSGLEWRDPEDSTFFEIASKIISRLNTPNALKECKKLHGIVLSNNNIKFLNNISLKQRYFENYLVSLSMLETPENVIAEYRTITPYYAYRDTKILENMILLVSDFKIYDFVPELWSDLIKARLKHKKDFIQKALETLLSTMVEYFNEENINKALAEQYIKIADFMAEMCPYYKKEVEPDEEKESFDKNKRTPKLFVYDWNSKMINSLFNVLLKSDNSTMVWKNFKIYDEYQNNVAGELTDNCLNDLFKYFNNKNEIDPAFEVFNHAVRNHNPVSKRFLATLEKNQTLNSDKRALLEQIKSKL